MTRSGTVLILTLAIVIALVLLATQFMQQMLSLEAAQTGFKKRYFSQNAAERGLVMVQAMLDEAATANAPIHYRGNLGKRDQQDPPANIDCSPFWQYYAAKLGESDYWRSIQDRPVARIFGRDYSSTGSESALRTTGALARWWQDLFAHTSLTQYPFLIRSRDIRYFDEHLNEINNANDAFYIAYSIAEIYDESGMIRPTPDFGPDPSGNAISSANDRKRYVERYARSLASMFGSNGGNSEWVVPGANRADDPAKGFLPAPLLAQTTRPNQYKEGYLARGYATRCAFSLPLAWFRGHGLVPFVFSDKQATLIPEGQGGLFASPWQLYAMRSISGTEALDKLAPAATDGPMIASAGRGVIDANMDFGGVPWRINLHTATPATLRMMVMGMSVQLQFFQELDPGTASYPKEEKYKSLKWEEMTFKPNGNVDKVFTYEAPCEQPAFSNLSGALELLASPPSDYLHVASEVANAPGNEIEAWERLVSAPEDLFDPPRAGGVFDAQKRGGIGNVYGSNDEWRETHIIEPHSHTNPYFQIDSSTNTTAARLFFEHYLPVDVRLLDSYDTDPTYPGNGGIPAANSIQHHYVTAPNGLDSSKSTIEILQDTTLRTEYKIKIGTDRSLFNGFRYPIQTLHWDDPNWSQTPAVVDEDGNEVQPAEKILRDGPGGLPEDDTATPPFPPAWTGTEGKDCSVYNVDVANKWNTSSMYPVSGNPALPEMREGFLDMLGIQTNKDMKAMEAYPAYHENLIWDIAVGMLRTFAIARADPKTYDTMQKVDQLFWDVMLTGTNSGALPAGKYNTATARWTLASKTQADVQAWMATLQADYLNDPATDADDKTGNVYTELVEQVINDFRVSLFGLDNLYLTDLDLDGDGFAFGGKRINGSFPVPDQYNNPTTPAPDASHKEFSATGRLYIGKSTAWRIIVGGYLGYGPKAKEMNADRSFAYLYAGIQGVNHPIELAPVLDNSLDPEFPVGYSYQAPAQAVMIDCTYVAEDINANGTIDPGESAELHRRVTTVQQ